MRLRNSSGLVMDLRMEEGSGTVAGDSSRYGNDGAVSGGVEWAEHGMRFDGSSGYLDCGNDASLKPSELTVSAWFYTSTIASEMTIVSTGETVATPGDGYVLTTLASKASWRVYRADRTISTIYSNVLENDKWYNVVGTHDRTITKIYVNGMYHNQGNVAGSSRGVKDIYIGRLRDVNRQFNGAIDDARIYNRALNASEIKAYYDATKYKYL